MTPRQRARGHVAAASPRRGFTLIEILISFFIVSIVLIALVNLTPMSHYTLRRGEHTLVADELARRLIEKRKAMPFETLEIGDEVSVPESHDDIEYTATVRYERLPDVDASVARVIDVKVKWKEKLTDEHGSYYREVHHRTVALSVPK